MKLFDLEQFLMLTMALATAGAVGVGVYSTRGAAADGTAEEAPTSGENAEEVFPEAAPEPAAADVKTGALDADATAAASAPGIAAEPMPRLDAAPELLDEVPGPQVEDMQW